jgi:hypothetical protein
MVLKRFILLFQLFCFLLGSWSCGTEKNSHGSSSDGLQGHSATSTLDFPQVFVFPGDYVEMKIGIKGNHISGVFFDEMNPNSAVCMLLFEGIIGTQNPIPIVAYHPSNPQKSIEGTFLVSGDAMLVKLNKTFDQSCNQEFVDGVGLAAVLFQEADWSAIRMIAYSTPLYEDYGGGLSDDMQLKNGEVVAILEKRNSWYRVEVQNDQKDLGWIEEYSLYPLLIKQ